MVYRAPATDSAILIVGAGTFGLSTAYELVIAGYTNITVLDRDTVPSQFSAGNDLNKIVRAEYEDPFYTELALEAITTWKTPFFSPYYHELGYLIAVSASAPEKASKSLKQSFASISKHPAFPQGSLVAMDSSADIKTAVPQLSGDVPGWTGYLNRQAGYASAAKALTALYEYCLDRGVTFITGEEGHAIEVLYGAGDEATGIKVATGNTYNADITILCLGAHVARLLPDLSRQVVAKCWAVGHVQLTEEQATRFQGMPVVNCRDLGFFFEPDPDCRLMKFCAAGAGYTNFLPGTDVSLPMEASRNTIPADDERLLRRLIEEALPEFKDRQLVKKMVCWCADTTDSDYVVDFVPGKKRLIAVTADSGHAFKMLPIAGRWVREVLESGVQKRKRWAWKGEKTGERENDISWRVGTVRDLGDALSGHSK